MFAVTKTSRQLRHITDNVLRQRFARFHTPVDPVNIDGRCYFLQSYKAGIFFTGRGRGASVDLDPPPPPVKSCTRIRSPIPINCAKKPYIYTKAYFF